MRPSISEITQLWDRILERLRGKINDRHIFDSFFAGSYLHGIDANTMVVVVNSGLAATLLATKYIDIISSVVRDVTESDFSLKFIQSSEIATITKQAEKKPTFFANSFINRKFTFDNFVVGTSNREASQAALMIASNPGKLYNYNPLFIFSHSGLGKTHLLHAIGNYIKDNTPALRVLYISTDDFVDEFIKYVHGDRESENLKDFFKAVDVLMVDDIQFLADKTKTEEMFFHIFNALINAGKQIILTSDRHPSELKGLESRLVSRFGSGLTMNITKPDKTTCVEILKRKIETNGLDVKTFDQDVLEFFAERFSNNVRELEGALNRLLFYVINIKQAKHIDMELALESVQPLMGANGPKTGLSETKIINSVADFYNLTPNQLTGKIRTSQIAMARHIAMYLIRTMLDLPFLKIGSLFGGKDHSTVMNAVSKVEKSLKTDQSLMAAVDQLQKRLKA
ncbi:MAG TPA: chromosomal replication initiator protein DnaA [Firmicutes bacterium]|jgi:chromosomal replication initiator protein|nr:chromosomal replication initiator protein DnaA [Bacillota bacterium]